MNTVSREQQLLNKLQNITLPDETYREMAEAHSNQLTKPPGSLGKLEFISGQLAAITSQLWPDLSKRAVIVMAGDHGVCEEGVSAFPSSVTPQMVQNFLNGGAAVNVLARAAGADVKCVDIGVAVDLEHPQLISRKIMYGTANMAKGAAMTREQAIQGIWTGIELVEELYEQGYRMFATGEMGIGNTTPSAAIVSILSNLSVEQAVGRGTGINDETWLHKISVIQKAISTNHPDAEDPIDVLSKVGGIEIAGLTGIILGSALMKCPVILDGYISTAAALVAAKLHNECIPYMISSHQSQEQGHVHALQSIGLAPMIQLDLRVGEGTGAAICFHLIDASLKLMQEMATFSSAGIDGKENR